MNINSVIDHFWKRCLNKQHVGVWGAKCYKSAFNNDITELEQAYNLNYYNKMIDECNLTPVKY